MVTHAVPVSLPEAQLPYRSSWVDALQARLEASRFALIAFYVGLPIAMFLSTTVSHWLDGSIPIGTFPWYYAIVPGNFVMAMALMHVLDRTAASALNTFRKALPLSDVEVARLHYRLTNLPARGALVSVVLGFASAALGLVVFVPAYATVFVTFSTPLSSTVEATHFVFNWIATTTLLYHSKHQLDVVRYIYGHCARVEIFRLDAVYAFSWLTARTSLGLAAIGYMWFFAAQDLYTDTPGLAIYQIGFTVVAAVLFVWPLWGIHRLLALEKRRMLDELGGQMHVALTRVGDAVRTGDMSDVDGLNKLVETLVQVRSEVERVSTWPWRADTGRLVVTTLLLPLAVYVGQRVIGATLGW